jgi:hypothetical protein
MPAAPFGADDAEDQPPDQGGSAQGDLLGHEAADGEPEQVNLAEAERGVEGDRVPRRLLDRVRGRAGRAADAGGSLSTLRQ